MMSKLEAPGISSDGAPRGLTTPSRRYRELVETVLLVLFWYAVNISLIISNKWLISNTGFHSTSLLTLLHMLSSCVASNTLLGLGFVPRRQVGWQLLLRVGVLAASFTISVATCMASLIYLPASFVQALGSTTPGFTAVLAFLIQGRREAAVTYAALLPVVVGIVLASGGEPMFSLAGLLLQIVACLFRSFKTVLQAVLLTDERDRFHPMTLLAYTSAMSAALLALLTAATEPDSLRRVAALHAKHRDFAPLLAVSCALAFLANWTNFIISKRLGALTLQVLGNFKNVMAAVAAIAVFANPVTQLGIVGYGMTTVGVFTYSHFVHLHPACWVPPPVAALLGPAFSYRAPLPQEPGGEPEPEPGADRRLKGKASGPAEVVVNGMNGYGSSSDLEHGSIGKRGPRVTEERAPLLA